MHVLLLDARHGFDFEALGHTVTSVTLEACDTPLDSVLGSLPAPPDLLIQKERLDERRFVSGLENAPCPTFFSTFDTHLNLYWQQYYTRLFDAVLTPHPSMFAALPPERAHPRAIPLPHAGYRADWKPHRERSLDLAFCGRLTSERPLRSRMLHLLQNRLGLLVFENIPWDEMFRLYMDTRVIPNEASFFELNCRLLESASAGAATLTPDCGPDQAAVFRDGQEMLVYHDGLDLCEKAAWLKNNPKQAEAMARAGWERVRREHLPAHRAASVLAALPSIRTARAKNADAAALTWLTRLERTLAGDKRYPVGFLFAQSEKLPEEPEILAGMIRLMGTPAMAEPGLDFCRRLLARDIGAGSGLCNAAASACAMTHGDFSLARRFWSRNALRAGDTRAPAPETPAAMCIAWAREERRAGRVARPGFPFRPDAGHLPACAHEFLLFAKQLPGVGHPETERIALEEMPLLSGLPAYSPYRYALSEKMSDETLPWRERLDRGLLCLVNCNLDKGLALVARARKQAVAGGRTAAFDRALAAWPSHAYIRDCF